MISSLDLATKSIFLDASTVNSSIHPIEIYRSVRELRRVVESYRIFDNPLSGFGYIPKGGGKFTERYFILNHGWRIVPYDISHTLTITGTLLTDDGFEGIYAFDRSQTSPSVAVDISYVPPQVEVIEVTSGSGLTTEEHEQLMGLPDETVIADSVWAKINDNIAAFVNAIFTRTFP